MIPLKLCLPRIRATNALSRSGTLLDRLLYSHHQRVICHQYFPDGLGISRVHETESDHFFGFVAKLHEHCLGVLGNCRQLLPFTQSASGYGNSCVDFLVTQSRFPPGTTKPNAGEGNTFPKAFNRGEGTYNRSGSRP